MTGTPRDPEAGNPPVGLPERVEQIPGVGPIRARCLRKAGWDSVEALQGASADQLAAVPGITDVKARQILAFLRSAATIGTGPDETASPPPPTDGDGSVPAPEAAGAAEPAQGRTRTPVQIAAVKVAASAGWLLQSPRAEGLIRSLSRQLSKLISVAGEIAQGAQVSAEQEENALRRLHRTACVLGDVTAASSARKGKQRKLSARLQSQRRKLRKLLVDDAERR